MNNKEKHSKLGMNNAVIVVLVMIVTIGICVAICIISNKTTMEKEQAESNEARELFIEKMKEYTYSNRYEAYVDSVSNDIHGEYKYDVMLQELNKYETFEHEITVRLNKKFDDLDVAHQAMAVRNMDIEIEYDIKTLCTPTKYYSIEYVCNHDHMLGFKRVKHIVRIKYYTTNGDEVSINLHTKDFNYYRHKPGVNKDQGLIYDVTEEQSGKIWATQHIDYPDNRDAWTYNNSKNNISNGNSSSSNHGHSNSSYKDDPYDKYWYDDPDDFAADWADEFDSYDDAYEYWEDEY